LRGNKEQSNFGDHSRNSSVDSEDFVAAPLNGRRAELALICAALAAVVASLVFVAIVSMEMLSAARGYTQGEALWSKGQKDAILHLARYAQTRSDDDYQRFRAAIHVPLACRAVRQQMDLPRYDAAILERGFAEAGIHEQDRNRMIRLYRYFGTEPHLSKAISIWAGAEPSIDALNRNGDRLRQRVVSGTTNQAFIEETLAENDRINRTLTPLEERFSESLAQASRWLHTLLISIISILAGLLIAAGSTAKGSRKINFTDWVQWCSSIAGEPCRV
jgi:hypothetical protein